MKKGFTLLELIVVIIILGVLATLGLTQYARMVERARGAEARAILGDLRKYAVAYRLEYGSVANVTAASLGLGNASDQIPNACRSSHYFQYSFSASDPSITLTGTRCTGGAGKTPSGASAGQIILTSDLNAGTDAWSGNGGY